MNREVVTFDSYEEACAHFNIELKLDLLQQTSVVEKEIIAYQSLSKFVKEHSLSFLYRLDGAFEIDLRGKANA